MKAVMRGLGAVALTTMLAISASAQEPIQTEQKVGFFKQAFRDMKESAKRQREIDKANFKAQKLESRAFYEEQKAMRRPEVRQGIQQQEYEEQMADARTRQEAAQQRIDRAKEQAAR